MYSLRSEAVDLASVQGVERAEAWYVLRTHVRKELQVDQYLQQRGLETFLPIKVVGVRGGAPVREPFFPGYLFFRLAMVSAHWPLVRWAPGAKQVLAFDGTPASVPDTMVMAIRHRLNAQGASVPAPGFKRGERIKVVAGPLAGFDAIFEEGISGARRACILIEIVGRLVKTQVAVDFLRRTD